MNSNLVPDEPPDDLILPDDSPSPEPIIGPAGGIPEGWAGYEEPGLAVGEWRFYRLEAQERHTSIKEDNWATKAGNPMPGEAGLAIFLQDLGLPANQEGINPDVLSRQIGMFLIRGHSRQSCAVRVAHNPAEEAGSQYARLDKRVHPPEMQVKDGKWVFKTWYYRGNRLDGLRLTLPPEGKLRIRWTQLYLT